MYKNYGILTTVKYIFFIIRSKLISKNIRLIRFPIDIRGKKSIAFGKGFTTGKNCRLETHSLDNKNCKRLVIGKNVQINDNVHISACDQVIIGNNVLIASKVYISDCAHGSYNGSVHSSPEEIPAKRVLDSKPVLIEDNVWLGDNVSVLPGVTIGRGSIIGTSSVVNKNIPKHCIAVGIPAKVIKRFNENTQKWERTNKTGEISHE